MTRTLARLGVPRATYRALFDTDLSADFGAAIDAIVAAGLATLDAETLRLTPKGMFYADSVVGLLTWQRVDALRATGAGHRTRDVVRERLELDDHMG